MKDYIAYLKFDDLSEEELIFQLEKSIVEKNKSVVSTINLDGMRICYKDSDLRKKINDADFVTIDGKPVLWIAKLCGKKKYKHKISGSDLTPKILKLANDKGYSVTIFGGKEGVADKAKKNIIKEYPNICVKKTICPNFGFEKDETLTDKYIFEINESQADIYLMCTGFPKTERFVFENMEKFENGLYLNVGATVDFIAGNIKRAPSWMQKCGLEWLYRLTHDFKRLFKRYWLDGLFLFKIVFICIFNKKKFEKMKNV